MLKSIAKFLRIANFIGLIRFVWFQFSNWRRRRFNKIDYVWFDLPTYMEALPQPRNWLQRRLMGSADLSLVELDRAFERIAHDPRPIGVILKIQGMEMSLADLQTLRQSILRLRDKQKRVICYAKDYDLASYYVASAADQILVQPGATLMTLGLRMSAVFLKDALATIGVQVEKIAISPFKSALDQFAENDISPENKAQLNWLLDSRYGIILNDIASARGVDADSVEKMIDTAPHLDTDSLKNAYIDGILNEEDLPQHLNVKHILPWDKADKKLLKQWRKRHNKIIALLPIRGIIVDGESARPPVDIPIPLLGSERAGDVTVVQQVRRLVDSKRIGAVILYVDSPGGSAAASEAMTAALEKLDCPLVVYMNGVAASGGYYVATPARWIVAQSGSITGSIGVITGKVTTQGLFDRLHAHRYEFMRGANVSMLSDAAPYTEAQRQQQHRMIQHMYQQFVHRVAKSRNMTQEAVDEIGGGRVWSGEQALQHGLIDEIGDLHAALKKTRELAELPSDAPVVMLRFKGDPIPPQLTQSADPAASLRYMYRTLRLTFNNRAQMLMSFLVE